MIRLESFDDRDFPRLMSWIDSREMLLQWAGPRLFTFPLDTMQLTRYSLRLALTRPQGSRIFKALDEEERVVGHVELGGLTERIRAQRCAGSWLLRRQEEGSVRADDSDRCCASGSKNWPSGGLTFASTRLITPRCIATRGRASWREGLLRQAVKAGDQYWDTVLMAILREEWAILSVSAGNAP